MNHFTHILAADQQRIDAQREWCGALTVTHHTPKSQAAFDALQSALVAFHAPDHDFGPYAGAPGDPRNAEPDCASIETEIDGNPVCVWYEMACDEPILTSIFIGGAEFDPCSFNAATLGVLVERIRRHEGAYR